MYLLKKKILKQIAPTQKEKNELKKISNKFLSKINIKNAKTELGGSVAKNTWLKNNHDIDIYVKFSPQKYKNKDLSKILYKKLKNLKNLKKIHGSRDYFQIQKGIYTIEFIPILNIRSVKNAQNITDVSPFHVKWVKKHKKYCDDIRLLKTFCKANKIYGAESYIKGFSGYDLEILTVYYKGFNNLIKKVSQWKDKTILDIEKHFKNKKEILKELNKSKKQSPLILIDPVQKERNAAAGLSQEKYNKFIKLAKRYKENPNFEFFIKKETTIKDLKEKAKGKKLILLEATPLEGKKDVVGAKLLKCLNLIVKHLKLQGFNIIDKGWEWNNKALFYLITNQKALSLYKRHYGPPKETKKALEKFKQKWPNKKIKFDKKKSYIIIKRDYRTIENFLKDFIKFKIVKNKVKKIKLL